MLTEEGWSHRHADGQWWVHPVGNGCDAPVFDGTADATHSINLSALVSNAQQWNDIYKEFTGIAREWGERVEYISVSSTVVGDDVEIVVEEDETLPGEYADEDTMTKVKMALASVQPSSLTPVNDAIIAMQNAGILFRERR